MKGKNLFQVMMFFCFTVRLIFYQKIKFVFFFHKMPLLAQTHLRELKNFLINELDGHQKQKVIKTIRQ